MTRYQFAASAVAAVVGVTLAVVAPMILVGTAGAAVVVAFLYLLSRCRHSAGLGLLPPTRAADGSRVPARWYCDSCGRTWSANLESDRAPIVRFSGYDQSKLPAAARRAATLDRQRHSLAVRRAGLAAHRSEAAVPANVTSIHDRRAAR